MKITTYNPKYKQEFIEMNKKWIKEMFVLEKEDINILNNIETYIKNGSEIFFAINEENDEVMSCCMFQPLLDGEWEIAKFASKDKYKGTGAGTAVLKACIEYAKQKGLDKILIVTNTKCEAAIHLYKKFGFYEIPVDKKKFPFDRGNIAFQKDFVKLKINYEI